VFNIDDQPAILKSCCGNGPIANYTGDGAPPDCFQYCNITDPSLTPDLVSECIKTALDKNAKVDTTWICGLGEHNNVTIISSGTSTSAPKNLGWIMLAIGIVSAAAAATADLAV
jgi:hypothetical protein